MLQRYANDMSLFETRDYRDYIRNWIAKQPKGGHGELSRIAAFLRINTAHLSQVMSARREFTPEQAHALSEYFGHNGLEIDYFMLLVQLARAGTPSLCHHIEKQLQKIKLESLSLANRITHERSLSEEQKTLFYSSWLFSAVHLFTSMSDKSTLESISTRFAISKSRAAEILHFLVSSGLVSESEGVFTMGTQSTYIAKDSPHILKHHSNWRIKALQKMESLKTDELMYSGQFSISIDDFRTLREQIAEFLKNANVIVKDSRAETLASLNIDWFIIE